MDSNIPKAPSKYLKILEIYYIYYKSFCCFGQFNVAAEWKYWFLKKTLCSLYLWQTFVHDITIASWFTGGFQDLWYTTAYPLSLVILLCHVFIFCSFDKDNVKHSPFLACSAFQNTNRLRQTTANHTLEKWKPKSFFCGIIHFPHDCVQKTCDGELLHVNKQARWDQAVHTARQREHGAGAFCTTNPFWSSFLGSHRNCWHLDTSSTLRRDEPLTRGQVRPPCLLHACFDMKRSVLYSIRLRL